MCNQSNLKQLGLIPKQQQKNVCIWRILARPVTWSEDRHETPDAAVKGSKPFGSTVCVKVCATNGSGTIQVVNWAYHRSGKSMAVYYNLKTSHRITAVNDPIIQHWSKSVTNLPGFEIALDNLPPISFSITFWEQHAILPINLTSSKVIMFLIGSSGVFFVFVGIGCVFGRPLIKCNFGTWRDLAETCQLLIGELLIWGLGAISRSPCRCGPIERQNRQQRSEIFSMYIFFVLLACH